LTQTQLIRNAQEKATPGDYWNCCIYAFSSK